ncbi:MAG: immune inhibitor A, partial [Prevotella sp.]|nr:immune inhibitor A [Prevotella sp.]
MRRFVLLSCFIFAVLSIWASGAYRLPIVVTQSDGTSLTILGHGNKDFNWITTSDGAIIVRQGNGFYIASVDEEGNIKATNQLAHNKGERNLEEQVLISKQNKENFLKVAQDNIRKAARKAAINDNGLYTPHLGNVKGIVILVEFSDTAFTLPNPKKSFEYYFNGEHYGDPELVNGEASLAGSVKKYFEDSSFGKYNPSFDVYGPVKINRKASYYGGKGKGSSLVRDACATADNIIDFSKPEYD